MNAAQPTRASITMNDLVQYFGARDHEAVSGLRAANSVSLSDVIPAALALSALSTDGHRSAGMLSRWNHFTTRGYGSEISSAIAARVGHKPITSLNEWMLVMDQNLGQFVLKRKDNVTLDGKKSLGHTVPMADTESEAQFKQQFIKRVAAARIATGMKQWQIAEALGMPQDKYKQYESRSMLPHHLIGRFSVICRVDPNWLLTGRGEKPLKPPHLVEAEPEPVAKPKRTKRTRAA